MGVDDFSTLPTPTCSQEVLVEFTGVSFVSFLWLHLWLLLNSLLWIVSKHTYFLITLGWTSLPSCLVGIRRGFKNELSCPCMSAICSFSLFTSKAVSLIPQMLALHFVFSILYFLSLDDILSLDSSNFSQWVSTSHLPHKCMNSPTERVFPLNHFLCELLSCLSVLSPLFPAFRSAGYKLPPTCLYFFS